MPNVYGAGQLTRSKDCDPGSIRVGDRVPVATQSAVSSTTPGAPIVNTIEQQDTGVLLRIRPRVSSGGRVILNIDQEVSDVVATTTSGIDSPTIQQRVIRTAVAVDDGQSVALGGLIRSRREKTRAGIPGLSKIPVLGGLFGTTTDTDTKTELLVIITPRVVRDSSEASKVTNEFRQQLLGPDRLIQERGLHHFKDISK